MDSDNDGQISSVKIDIKRLSMETLEAFAPLLCEMEEHDLTLDRETFLLAADRLLSVTPSPPSNPLIA